MLLIISAITGIILGLRFKVLVLGPAMAVIAVTAILSSHEPRVIVLTVFGAAASLQIGYFAGCVLEDFIVHMTGAKVDRAAARERPRRRASQAS